MSPRKNYSRQRGFSLAEVLVATAILVIVLVGILTLYDRANQVFKSGSEASDLQQNVRVAYERMVGDIRMAGFDYKRGGPLMVGQNAAPWAAARTYNAGTIVTPVAPNGHTYRATNAGTSGNTEPSWPTGTGATTIESGATPAITWQENGGAVYEQPDEQIEYAGSTALTVRGNYNYSDNPAATDHGREFNLESAQFPIVTTGNSEIVTYALVSNTAPSGTAPNNQSITFFADINVPRSSYPGGTAENQVQINGVDLTNANPPYTLYRFTIDNAGNIVRTPLADNIRSLNFFYFSDAAGQTPLRDTNGVLQPNVGGGGQYNPAVAGSLNAPQRLERKAIRAIRVRLVGMNSQPDINYADTSTGNGQYSSSDTAGFPVFSSDTVAPTYRRLTVDTVVSPRNLGMTGLPQSFLQPPPRPTITNVCIGYCGIAVINWNPNTSNPNASYAVGWDRTGSGTIPPPTFSNAFDAGTSNTYAMDLTQQDLTQPFYFQVRAFNAGGSVFSTNILGPVSAANATKPNPPEVGTISASGAGGIPPIAGRIHLKWSAPTTNAPGTGAPSCTPSGTPPLSNYLREIRGFRIFRGTTINFNATGSVAGTGNCIVDENSSGPTAPLTDGYGDFWWDDTTVVACGQTYYYRLATVEWCAANANYNTSGLASDGVSSHGPPNTQNAIPGQAGSLGAPAVPVNLQAAPLAPTVPPAGMTNSACNAGTNVCSPINLMWSKVTQDVSANAMSIDSYDIERTQLLNGTATGPATVTNITGALAMSGSSVSYTDSGPMHDPVTLLNYTYSYRVRAVQPNPCPSGGWSAAVVFPPPCTFSGSVIVETGALSGDGLTQPSAWVMNAGDVIEVQPPAGTSFTFTQMQIVNSVGTVISTQSSTNTGLVGNRVDFVWVDLAQGTYTCTFTMTNNAVPPCTQQLVRYVTQQPPPVCHLTTFAGQPSVLHQTAVNYQLQLDLMNTTTEALTLTEIDFTWSPPSQRSWNSIQFPSGATVTGPGSTGGTYTATLFPIPGTVTVNDVTVPVNGTRSILLNFSRSGGSPSPTLFPISAISNICVRYTAASQGTSFIFHCQILPDVSANNPTACQ